MSPCRGDSRGRRAPGGSPDLRRRRGARPPGARRSPGCSRWRSRRRAPASSPVSRSGRPSWPARSAPAPSRCWSSSRVGHVDRLSWLDAAMGASRPRAWPWRPAPAHRRRSVPAAWRAGSRCAAGARACRCCSPSRAWRRWPRARGSPRSRRWAWAPPRGCASPGRAGPRVQPGRPHGDPDLRQRRPRPARDRAVHDGRRRRHRALDRDRRQRDGAGRPDRDRAAARDPHAGADRRPHGARQPSPPRRHAARDDRGRDRRPTTSSRCS